PRPPGSPGRPSPTGSRPPGTGPVEIPAGRSIPRRSGVSGRAEPVREEPRAHRSPRLQSPHAYGTLPAVLHPPRGPGTPPARRRGNGAPSRAAVPPHGASVPPRTTTAEAPPSGLGPDDPARVGPYRIRARLGGGGMGQVFLGRSPGAHAVAVNVVRPDLARDPDFRRRFTAEVEIGRASCSVSVELSVEAESDV